MSREFFFHIWTDGLQESQFVIIASEYTGKQSLDSTLHQARLSRRLGRFEEALALLPSENNVNAEVAFERFRVFEEMGEMGKCLECVETFQQTTQQASQEESNSAKLFLLKIASAYIGCFVKGEWQNAMELALLAHETYLSGRISFDVATVGTVCLILLSLC